MVSNACRNILPDLMITELNCGCSDSTSRYRRIARNAILPFYYDCTGVSNLENCNKVFFLKNATFYSGTSSNISSSLLTQAMRYSKLAQNVSKTPEGRRNNLNISYLNHIIINSTNTIWYNGEVKYNLENQTTNNIPQFICGKLKN
jgi:hypothetical protein